MDNQWHLEERLHFVNFNFIPFQVGAINSGALNISHCRIYDAIRHPRAQGQTLHDVGIGLQRRIVGHNALYEPAQVSEYIDMNIDTERRQQCWYHGTWPVKDVCTVFNSKTVYIA